MTEPFVSTKDIHHYKNPKRKRPKIRMLTDCFGWNVGDEFIIQMESEKELYFDDVNERWTYIEKSEEGVEFEYIRRYNAGT